MLGMAPVAVHLKDERVGTVLSKMLMDSRSSPTSDELTNYIVVTFFFLTNASPAGYGRPPMGPPRSALQECLEKQFENI